MWKTIQKVLKKNHNASESDINKITPYIFVKWLASNPKTVLAGNQLNRYYNIPFINQFSMINNNLGGRGVYIKYIGGLKINKTLYESMQWYYTIGSDVVDEYLEFTSPEQVEDILQKYSEYQDIQLANKFIKQGT